MDHHCDFLGQCVGIKNQKNFILFLIYTFIYSLIIILRTFDEFFINGLYKDGWQYFTKSFHLGMFLLQVFCVMIAWGTIYLCFFYLKEQIAGIIKNQSTIESFQEQRGKKVIYFYSI